MDISPSFCYSLLFSEFPNSSDTIDNDCTIQYLRTDIQQFFLILISPFNVVYFTSFVTRFSGSITCCSITSKKRNLLFRTAKPGEGLSKWACNACTTRGGKILKFDLPFATVKSIYIAENYRNRRIKSKQGREI